ncbi:GNAT family N-acetyltransferase [Paenibacillus radicis (ex Gao et al. 2016)]|uniref:N-acetyltransferase n=1 Tax=Paenibacillus radicis (ex Gao et al. 2016) TaxID=1737354 RepID=A0A917HA11_9BACL|nr:GNAT family N-acetyltransferase [Paenibacillus radicis (ex Gao et al. 2016)]GGG72523.1 N-acetyltransferase [Paenibacillus radicis (ex Gao et al. 2016)]
METDRCIMVKLQQSDYEAIKKIYTNEKVRAYLGGAIPEDYTLNKFQDILERSNKDSFYWTVRTISNDEFMGLVSLDKHSEGVNIEVSYEFLPNWWGNGYASEVITRILSYALNELHISKVIAETQTANVASCRLLEKVGMNLERIVQRYDAEQAIYAIEK